MKDKESHIVFLTPGFASSEEDSTVIPALAIYLKELKKTIPKARLTVIAFQYPKFIEQYKWFDITVIPLNGSNKRIKKPFIFYKAKMKLNQLNEKQPISCVHSFWIGDCSFIGQRFSIKNNINHVVTVMGQESVVRNRFVKFINEKKSKIVSLSKNHSEDLKNKLNISSQIIPWGISSSSFPDLELNSIDILGVGFLNDVKNYSFFIKVIAFLVKKHPNIKVEIIGEGKKYTSLKEEIKKLNLNKNIKLTGLLPRSEVLLKMSKSNILLHTSRYESFGFVFPEALYSGMRIVSTNVGCASESMFWKVGGNVKDLASYCDDFLLFTTVNKKRIHLYSIENTIKSYLNLYQLTE
ncbi:hypothetical protein BA195_04655 [Tenacibaculum soleae]|uniref:Glycosyl transferase family 1 domain-containing protein n=1 Tax=Tenacibaculum soleae TaxID=447689 RepID=A0A1B9Y2H6_9FLAO|nr:glycosyltransferase [Tenacibaculum soleae]OCK43990.1 hypothetical protein BA195_04655 [Tenacibaculum soleae]